MWFVTVAGLCLGGGQLGLGIAGTIIGSVILWAMKWVDDHIARAQHARLIVKADRDGRVEEIIRGDFPRRRFNFRMLSKAYCEPGKPSETYYEVRWQAHANVPPPLACLDHLKAEPGVLSVSLRTMAV